MKYRYIPHPEDELEVDVKFDGLFNEINVHLMRDDTTGYCFVAQVNDRLAVKDQELKLYLEFVNKDQLIKHIFEQVQNEK